VIGCGFAVLNAHGDGFLDKALEIVLVNATRQLPQNESRQFLPRLDSSKPRLAIDRVSGGLSNATTPSACFACIRLYLR